MSAPIVTPLTYNDAITLAMMAAPDVDVHTLVRIAKTLMAVDVASREQAAEVHALNAEYAEEYEGNPPRGSH